MKILKLLVLAVLAGAVVAAVASRDEIDRYLKMREM